MTAAQLDALCAAALLHLRRSIGTSAGMHLAHWRKKLDQLKREKGVA